MTIELDFTFPAQYAAEVISELPPGFSPAFEFRHSLTGTGGKIVLLEVRGKGISPWIGELRGRGLTVKSAITGLYSTPNAFRLSAVIEGDAWLIDVRQPEKNELVSTAGPVVAVKPIDSAKLLLLASPWNVTAIGEKGMVWQTERLAIDGLRLDEVKGKWLAGVADPEDTEPRNFVIHLPTGQHEGGSFGGG